MEAGTGMEKADQVEENCPDRLSMLQLYKCYVSGDDFEPG